MTPLLTAPILVLATTIRTPVLMMVHVYIPVARMLRHAIMIFLRVAITLPAFTPVALTNLLATSTKVLLVMTARACMVAALYRALAITTHKQVAMMARVHLPAAQHLMHATTM